MQEHDEWGSPEPRAQITLEQMTQFVLELRQAKERYEEAKDAATTLHNIYEDKRKIVLDALTSQGLENYKVPGVGTVYTSSKEIYRVPNTVENKKLLFDYIKDKYGPDSLMSMVGINHQTLNSWANKESDTGVMSIPGLEQPTIEVTVGMRRS